MRATRDLLRRRLHLVRKRGELLAHIQNTEQLLNRPDIISVLQDVGREGMAPMPAPA
jgi:hypothetical protein